jgi:hypothetical protein
VHRAEQFDCLGDDLKLECVVLGTQTFDLVGGFAFNALAAVV